MKTVDWASMSPREVRLAIAAAPKVAPPWKKWRTNYEEAWSRDGVVVVMGTMAKTFMIYTLPDEVDVAFGIETAIGAMRIADAHLQSLGFILDDEDESS